MSETLGSETEIIVGQHSIAAALKNKDSRNLEIIATKDGLQNLKKQVQKLPDIKVRELSNHAFQDESKKLFEERDLTYRRVVGGCLLLRQRQEPIRVKSWLASHSDSNALKEGSLKLLTLDGVTDVGNLGAIWRTAAFFGVHGILWKRKPEQLVPPSVYRNASGAAEIVPLVWSSNLAKDFKVLSDAGFINIGLDERGESVENLAKQNHSHLNLVFGAEEEGLSHVVKRQLDQTIKLTPRSNFSTLNVSSAVSVTLSLF